MKVDKKEQEAFDAGVLELFRALDIDGDKVVTHAEVLKRLQSGTVPDKMVEQFADGIMKDVDKDHNATLSMEEWTQYFHKLQAKLGGAPFPLDGFRGMFGLVRPRGQSNAGSATPPTPGKKPPFPPQHRGQSQTPPGL